MNPETFGDWAQLAWNGDRLAWLQVPGVRVDGAVIDDPLLGRAHRIGDTTMSALDWARPTEIPAIAAPARLPANAGGAVLNVIALLAVRAGVPALRYAGPYPTAALWRSLARSFTTTGTEAAFTADAVHRMATLARDPIAIDFHPAPHDRRTIAGGVVELRAGVERVVLDGIAYEPGGSPARLVDDLAAGARHRCELWFGDIRYAHVATLASDGALVEHRAIPPCTSPVLGKPFPPQLVAALAELVADAVPPLLADAARAWLATGAITWADLGARTAMIETPRIFVHAALWDHVAPHGMPRLALALAEALAPVVARELTRSST